MKNDLGLTPAQCDKGYAKFAELIEKNLPVVALYWWYEKGWRLTAAFDRGYNTTDSDLTVAPEEEYKALSSLIRVQGKSHTEMSEGSVGDLNVRGLYIYYMRRRYDG